MQIDDPISATADWYRLGGTSLKAIALAAVIKERFKVKGSTAELLTLNTIVQQALHLKQFQASNATGGAVAADEAANLQEIVPHTWSDDYRPASFGQQQVLDEPSIASLAAALLILWIILCRGFAEALISMFQTEHSYN